MPGTDSARPRTLGKLIWAEWARVSESGSRSPHRRPPRVDILLVNGVCAETLMGKVIKIADGDTLTIWTPPIPKIEVSTKAG
jgi:hypothetical protein